MHLLSIASTKFPEWTHDPHLSLCLGACHSLTVRNGRLTGDPGELKVHLYYNISFLVCLIFKLFF